MILFLDVMVKTGKMKAFVVSAAQHKKAELGVTHRYLDFAAPAKKVKPGPIINLPTKMS